jgi:predicted ATPase/transcriptional regulator with XRE-family HTH domain
MVQERSGDRATNVVAGFGARLRHYRELAGLSQDQLAERAGLSAKAIGALERGERRRPHPQTVDLLVKALGLGPAERAALVAAAVGHGSALPVASSLASSSRPAVADSEPIPAAPLLAEGVTSRSNLPAPPTAFVGREREVGELTDLLRRRDGRLVTLTGPGGTGKTRLAIEVADRVGPAFPDGVFFVSLATVTDPGLVVSTIAQTIGVRESASRPLIESLQAFLREKTGLLVLDNFEQVVSAAPMVGELLLTCPSLQVLVTSRTLLRVYGEHERVVEPLEIPDPRQLLPLDRLSHFESVQLFVARAQAARADFHLSAENAPAVAAICSRLDGLPLAIELAAARVRVFSPAALLARLESRLDLLTSGARDVPARQQTMRNTIDWSYALLDESEQVLFRRLCIFVGSFDLPSVEAVCEESGDGLDALVAKSLVRTRPTGGEPWFGLFETIREYGLERLEESGEKEAVERAHALYFLARGEEIAVANRPTSERYLRLAITTERLEDIALANRPTMEPTSTAPWREMDFASKAARLVAIEDNLRAAFSFFVSRRAGEPALRLAIELAEYFRWQGALRLPRDLLTRALTVEVVAVSLLRANALAMVVDVATGLGDYPAAEHSGQQALELYRALGNRSGMANTLAALGFARSQQGDYAGSLPLFDEALRIQRQVDDPASLYQTLTNLADSAVDREDAERARSLLGEALPLARQFGGEYLRFNLWNLARLALLDGDFARAEVLAKEGLALARQDQSGGATVHTLYCLAYLAARRGDLASARNLTAEALATARVTYDYAPYTWYGLDLYAIIAQASGQSERAARLAGAATALREANRTPRHPIWRTLLRRVQVPVERPSDDREIAAWDEGLAMTVDQAVVYALEETSGGFTE